jgi:hypothetical protein
MINLKPLIDGVYEVYFNSVRLGEFVVQSDGYYGFVAKSNAGFWSSYGLRLISDKLDEINKEWDQQVKKDIGSGE